MYVCMCVCVCVCVFVCALVFYTWGKCVGIDIFHADTHTHTHMQISLALSLFECVCDCVCLCAHQSRDLDSYVLVRMYIRERRRAIDRETEQETKGEQDRE